MTTNETILTPNYSPADKGDNPVVNVATGRLKYSFADVSVGQGNYTIAVNHVYNNKIHEAFSSFCAGAGTNWKLNAHQAIIKDGNTYKYMDASGEIHKFIYFDTNAEGQRYYQYKNAQILLIVPTNEQEQAYIVDGAGNKLYFRADGKLARSVSCYNNQIEKIFQYDENNLLTTIYDSRNLNNGYLRNKIQLEYTDGILNSITSYKGSKKLNRFIYTYENNHLVHVETQSFNKGNNPCMTKDVWRFKYIESNLLALLECESKTAMTFAYDTAGRIQKVDTGVLVENCLSLGAQDGSGNNSIFCGELHSRPIFANSFKSRASKSYQYTPFSEEDPTSVETIVTDEKGISIAHFMDRDYNITASFEKDGSNYKTLAFQGGKMVGITGTGQVINGSASKNNASKIFVPIGPTFDVARNKLETNFCHFEYSFWLKISTSYSRMHARLKYNFVTDKEYCYQDVPINEKAINAWQRVSIPVSMLRKDKSISTSGLFEFAIDLITNGNSCSETFEFNEIGFTPAPLTFLNLESTTASVPLPYNVIENVNIKTSFQNYSFNNKTNPDLFFTESDILATYTNKVVRSHSAYGKTYYDVICNNGSKRIANVYSLQFTDYLNDISSKQDSTVLYTKLISGGTKEPIKTKYTYTPEKLIIKNEATIEKGNDKYTPSAEKHMDYFGRLVYEKDEYGIYTTYSFDEYGNPNETKTYGSDGSLMATSTVTYDERKECVLSSADGNFYTNYTYDDFGNITQTNSSDNQNTFESTIESKTGIFRDRVIDVTQTSNGTATTNKVTYQDGRIRTVSDGTVKFGIQHDLVNNAVTYTQFTSPESHEEIKLRTDKISNGLMSLHESTYWTEDGTVSSTQRTTLDKYGQVVYFHENGHRKLQNEQQGVSASGFANKLYSSSDMYVGKTTYYNYNDDNNCTGWEEKDTENDEQQFAVRQVSDTITKYTFGEDEEYFASITYDATKLFKPRVTETTAYRKNLEENKELEEFKKQYSYNAYGLVNQTTSTIKIDSGLNTKPGITNYSYNKRGNTFDCCKLTFIAPYYSGDTSAPNNYENSCSYDNTGNLIKYADQYISYNVFGNELTSKTEYAYEYDKLGRLKKETNLITEAVKTYSYNSDGRYLVFANHLCSYDSRGRMVSCGNTSFAYDNYGNRTSKTKNGTITNYTFTRGDLLASVNNATYTYNAKGVREIKNVDGMTIKYYLDNNKILGEDHINENGKVKKEIRYFYDKDGVCGFRYNGNNYSYVKDILGNIIAIYTTLASTYHRIECRYKYDAYGNCQVLNRRDEEKTNDDFIGNINPFRWKGHYYDTESGLYYANGSYYDPEFGQYLDASPIEAVEQNAYVNRSLDRNNILCNNIFLLVACLCGIFTIDDLVPDPNYDSLDDKSWFSKLTYKISNWYKSIHWAAKIVIGIALIVLSLAIIYLTDGAASEAIIKLWVTIAVGTTIGVASWAIMTLLAGEALTWEGALNAFADSFLASAFTAFVNAGISGLKHAIRKSLLNHANYAQKSYSYNFSDKGKIIYSDIVGEEISNIDDLVSAIQNNKISAEQIPVEYIMKKGRPLILNTRTGNALTKAGIPRSKWHWVNKTSDIKAQERLLKQLARNNLTYRGFKNPILE